MSRVYDPSSSNRTSMPFSDLQGILNAQFQNCIFLINYNFSMSENSVIQKGHMLVFRPDKSREVGLSSDLIF